MRPYKHLYRYKVVGGGWSYTLAEDFAGVEKAYLKSLEVDQSDRPQIVKIEFVASCWDHNMVLMGE